MAARSLPSEMASVKHGGSCAVAGYLCELLNVDSTPHAGFDREELKALNTNAKRLIGGGKKRKVVHEGDCAFFKPIKKPERRRNATGAWVKFVYHERTSHSHIVKYVLFREPPSAADLAAFQAAVGLRLRVAEGNWVLAFANHRWNATQAGPPMDLAYQQGRGLTSASKRPRLD